MKGFGYSTLDGSSATDLRFYLHATDTDQFRAQLLVDEESGVLDLRVYCTDFGYNPSIAAQVADIANRLNENVPFALLYIQPESGAVILKLTFDARNGASVGELERWMNLASFPLRLFSSSFDKLCSQDADAEAAYSAALIANSVHSDSVLAKTRRALLKVEGGGLTTSSSLGPSIERSLSTVSRDLGLI